MSEEEIKDVFETVIRANRFSGIYSSIDIIIEAMKGLLDLYKQEKEKNKNCINPDKARISYFDTKKGMQVVIEGFIPKSKLKQILYPTPENPIDLEIQNSKMYKKLLELIGE